MTRVPTTRRLGTHRVIAAGGLSVLSLAVAAACSSAPSASSSASTSPSAAGGASSAPAVTTSSSAAPSSAAPAPSTSASGAVATSAAAGGAYKACMVLDTGGVNDHSFNQSSWAGMQAAAKANPKIAISYVSSASANDYTPNLTNEIAKKCDTIVGVGGIMGAAVTAAAKANPTQKFAEVDASSTEKNLFPIQFDTAQGGFLGGYLAASMSKTGKVGTYGGIKIAPVTVYMDGFYDGVQYYNQQKKKSVAVLGWDEKTQNGTFANSFSDAGAGKNISNALIQQGADVIFPVAGGAGLGAPAAAKATGGKVSVIWVDTDGCISDAADCSVFLSSVVKGLTTSVETYVAAAVAGTIPTTGYVGTLANGGTGIAPYHQFASKVPASVTTELAAVKKGIEDGSIKVASPSAPTS